MSNLIEMLSLLALVNPSYFFLVKEHAKIDLGLQDGRRDKDFIPFQNWPDSLTSKVNRNEKKVHRRKNAMKILRCFHRNLPGAAV